MLHAYMFMQSGIPVLYSGDEIGQLIEDNHELIYRRAAEIRELVDEPMDFSHLCAKVCQKYELFSPRPRRALYYERNIRFFIEFLVDRGDLEMESRQGVAYYRKAEK